MLSTTKLLTKNLGNNFYHNKHWAVKVDCWKTILQSLTLSKNSHSGDLLHTFLKHAIYKNEVPSLLTDLQKTYELIASDYEACKILYYNLWKISTINKNDFPSYHAEVEKLFANNNENINLLMDGIYNNLKAKQHDRVDELIKKYKKLDQKEITELLGKQSMHFDPIDKLESLTLKYVLCNLLIHKIKDQALYGDKDNKKVLTHHKNTEDKKVDPHHSKFFTHDTHIKLRIQIDSHYSPCRLGHRE